MSNKEILELILSVSGFEIKNYQNYQGSYEFDVYKKGVFQFEVATDSFEDSVRETVEGIYKTDDVVFI